MTYTIADLDNAIENEDTKWEGSWFEFEECIDSTHEYVVVPEGTEGAKSYDNGKTFEKRVPKAVPGVDIPGIGRATMVERYGGEGRGDELWLVFQVEDEAGEKRLFRRNGWYASFSGGELDGPTVPVRPVNKTITVWEEVV